MELLYKPEWEQTKQNYLAWWAHEDFGRCAVHVTAPKKGVNLKPPSLPEKVEDRWLDFDYLIAMNEYKMKTTFYGGEAIPQWNPGHPGIDGLFTYLGGNTTLDESTGWQWPLFPDGELIDHDYRKLTLQENRWRKFGRDTRRLAVRESKGKCIPSNFGIGACGDTLAALRGSKSLLYDVIDCPEYVRDFDMHLMKFFEVVYDESYAITSEGAEGSTCWFPMWSPGKFYALQNDFAYMISNKMFNEIFMPTIEMQTKYLDNSVYHLDGVENFRHKDSLLSLERLQAYQIAPGAGKPNALYYMDILKKVQAHKRNLHIYLPPGEVKHALDQLSSRGLYIVTMCDTEDEACELLKNVEKWSVDRG